MPKTPAEQIALLEKKIREQEQQIDELQQQNFYFDTILGLMPAHVYWLDKNNIYLGCNELQAKNIGLKSRYEIIGKTNFDLLWKGSADAFNAVNNEVMRTGTAIVTEEFGETIHGRRNFLSNKVPLKNIQGNIIGVIGISFDITERKQIEQDLKDAKEKAELASQVKTEFLKNMSHDLRTPFSGILGFTNILLKQEQDPNKHKKINYIKEASESLVKLLNEIIEMSYIEQGRVLAANVNFNLRNLIDELMSLVAASVKFKNLELFLEYPTTSPENFFGDKIKLHRILLNLIGNAIRFTEKGYIKIKVSFRHETTTDVEANIAVEDTGVGIAADKFHAIFEQFTRLNNGGKDIYAGTGLGLYIVKKFITELNGNIQVESEVGKGSIFTVKLPIRFASA